MKTSKWIKALAIAVLALGLIACGGNDTSDDSNSSTSTEDSNLTKSFFQYNNTYKPHVATGPMVASDHNDQAKNAYQFDGQDDIVEIAHHNDYSIEGNITLSAWVYTDDYRSATIVRKGGVVHTPYGLTISGSHDVIFSLNLVQNGSETWTQVRKHGYDTETWFHVTGTYDGHEIRLYIDGTLESTIQASGTISVNGDDIRIGTRIKLPANTWKGKIEGVRLYDHVLTSGEIGDMASK